MTTADSLHSGECGCLEGGEYKIVSCLCSQYPIKSVSGRDLKNCLST